MKSNLVFEQVLSCPLKPMRFNFRCLQSFTPENDVKVDQFLKIILFRENGCQRESELGMLHVSR